MTPEELWDKWVDPYGKMGPNDPAKKLFLEDVKEMMGSKDELSFDEMLKEANDNIKKQQKQGGYGYGGFRYTP